MSTTPLTGEALKARIAEMADAPKYRVAIACGYVSDAGRVRIRAFESAILDAHGLGFRKPPGGRRGKPLSFQVAANKNGQIVMAASYAGLIGVQPGERVQIAHQGNALILTAATPAVANTAVVTYDAMPAQVLPELAMA